MKTEEQITERITKVVDLLLIGSFKTDLDSQIKAIETLNKNLINTPTFEAVISSLKELRGIKRNK